MVYLSAFPITLSLGEMTVTEFFDRLAQVFNSWLGINTTLFNFIANNMLLSFILAAFVIRLLKGFYERLKRIF